MPLYSQSSLAFNRRFRKLTISAVVAAALMTLTDPIAPVDARIGFTRTTVATARNGLGVQETFGVNVPRREFDVSALPLQNGFTWSQDFTNAVWANNAISYGATIPGPVNSNTTGLKFIPSTASGNHFRVRTDSASGSVIADSYSFAMKAGEYGFGYIVFVGVSNGAVWFDLVNGVLGTVQSDVVASMVPLGDGWYLCSARKATAIAHTQIRVGVAPSNGLANFVGDGTSGIYVAYAQKEPRLTAPPEYVPTTNVAVVTTRFPMLGLLIEPQATNLCTTANTADLGTGALSLTKTLLGPDGQQNSAYTASENTGSDGNQFCNLGGSMTVTAVPTTFSAIIAAGTRDRAGLTITGGLGGVNLWATFNLTAGTVLRSGTSTTGAAIEKYAVLNGETYWRVSFVGTPTAGTGNVIPFHIASDTDGRIPFYTGLGRTIKLFAAQAEVGTVVTSQIMSAGAATTRTADTPSVTVVAGGSTSVVYTFDDNSTQTVAVAAGSYTIPTNLNRRRIRSMLGTFQAVVDPLLVDPPVASWVSRVTASMPALPAYFVGVHSVSEPVNEPVEAVEYDMLRSVDYPGYPHIETGDGVYDTDALGKLLRISDRLCANNKGFQFEFTYTPAWNSTGPTTPSGGYLPLGAAEPIANLTKLSGFVTALLGQIGGKFKAAGLPIIIGGRNEPNDPTFYHGTAAQLVAEQAAIFNPAKAWASANSYPVIVRSPSMSAAFYINNLAPGSAISFQSFVAAGGLAYCDDVGYHSYGSSRSGLGIDIDYAAHKAAFAGHTAKDVTMTEAGWSDALMVQAIDIIRAMILARAAGLKGWYYYSYDIAGVGNMGIKVNPAALNLARRWMLNNTLGGFVNKSNRGPQLGVSVNGVPTLV